MFSAGVVGAAMAAAIVCSLACAWGLGEIFGLRHSLEREARERLGVLFVYSAWVLGSAALVLFVTDLVWLSIGMQVLNAVLLPVVVIAARDHRGDDIARGRADPRLAFVADGGLVGLVAVAGLVGAVAGLL